MSLRFVQFLRLLAATFRLIIRGSFLVIVFYCHSPHQYLLAGWPIFFFVCEAQHHHFFANQVARLFLFDLFSPATTICRQPTLVRPLVVDSVHK